LKRSKEKKNKMKISLLKVYNQALSNRIRIKRKQKIKMQTNIKLKNKKLEIYLVKIKKLI